MGTKAKAAKDAVREANAYIAAAYDTVPYDPAPSEVIHPAVWSPIAVMFGLNGQPQDILDLGCGSGAQLQMLAEGAGGRLVGVDISKVACDMARARFSEAGMDVDVRCADILDLDPGELGQFDLIACIGSLYIVPGRVRDRILEIVGRCLRPGGVALFSYYGGQAGDIRASLQRVVAANVGEDGTAEERLSKAHATLQELIAIAAGENVQGVYRAVLEQVANLEPVLLFHEMLGATLNPQHTISLHQALSAHGIGFLTTLPRHPCLANPSSKARAIQVGAQEAMAGGYCYAAFGKWPGPERSIDLAAAGVLWSTTLSRTPGGGETDFLTADGVFHSKIGAAPSRSFVRAIAERPRTFDEAAEAACAELGDEGAFNRAQVETDLFSLWLAGPVTAARKA